MTFGAAGCTRLCAPLSVHAPHSTRGKCPRHDDRPRPFFAAYVKWHRARSGTRSATAARRSALEPRSRRRGRGRRVSTRRRGRGRPAGPRRSLRRGPAPQRYSGHGCRVLRLPCRRPYPSCPCCPLLLWLLALWCCLRRSCDNNRAAAAISRVARARGDSCHFLL